MNGLEKIHDCCFEYESSIDSDVDMLEDKRIEAYKSGDKEIFKEIIPVLNAITHDVEAYREYILSLFGEETV